MAPRRLPAAAAGCVALALSGSAAAEIPSQIAFRLDYQVESPELRMVVPPAFMESAAGEPSEAPLTPREGTAPSCIPPAQGKRLTEALAPP